MDKLLKNGRILSRLINTESAIPFAVDAERDADKIGARYLFSQNAP